MKTVYSLFKGIFFYGTVVVTWIRIDVQYNQTHQTVKILHIVFTCTTHTVNHKLHATGQEMKAIKKLA